MKLEMRGQMRLEQQMKLAPHMIQSMEILQLPILVLQERIEQELNANPVLEIEEPAGTADTETAESPPQADADDTDRTVLDDRYQDSLSRSELPYRQSSADEPDRKLEAIKNTVAPSQSIHEYLEEQWRLVEAAEPVKKAGEMIIDYIDDRGYLTVRLEQLQNKDRPEFTFEDLKKAIEFVQKLEPAGVGARDIRECLLIQMAQSAEDMSFEMRLVLEHINDLFENHLPEIAKKMNCSLEAVNRAVVRISRFDTSPGLQIGQNRNHPVTPDVIVEQADDTGEYTVRLANMNFPSLRISSYYSQIAKDAKTDQQTKKFLDNNIQSAQWIISAIEQRNKTVLNVAKAIVKYQKEFFDKGQLFLQPLPMSKVADNIGIHLATVSRAVAGKYVQCSWGILPLRKFFSGGVEDEEGRAHSWEAIRAKLQQIVDEEDKSKPLSDDQICRKLAGMGIKELARRTVAKYRKLMKIPPARLRKKY